MWYGCLYFDLTCWDCGWVMMLCFDICYCCAVVFIKLVFKVSWLLCVCCAFTWNFVWLIGLRALFRWCYLAVMFNLTFGLVMGFVLSYSCLWLFVYVDLVLRYVGEFWYVWLSAVFGCWFLLIVFIWFDYGCVMVGWVDVCCWFMWVILFGVWFVWLCLSIYVLRCFGT